MSSLYDYDAWQVFASKLPTFSDLVFYLFMTGLLALLGYAVYIFVNMAGSKARYYELEDQGRFVCVETWEWKHTNETKECMRFEPQAGEEVVE